MKEYLRCPRCKKLTRVAKVLHCSWECPNCHNEIVPKEERKINEFQLRSILKKQNNFKKS